jgi:hypothetical protein
MLPVPYLLPLPKYRRYIEHGFAIRRNAAAIPGHRSLAGVVGRQRQGNVATMLVEQVLEVAHAGVDVLRRIGGVGHAVACRSRRHQLHRTHCPLPAKQRSRC